MRAHLLTLVVPHSHIAPLENGAHAGMEFIQSGPDIVRSDSQRRLLNYWASLRGHAPLPIWRDLDAEEVGVPLDSLAWTDVVSAHRDMRFRIGFHGAKLIEAFGPSSASANISTKCSRRHTSDRQSRPTGGS